MGEGMTFSRSVNTWCKRAIRDSMLLTSVASTLESTLLAGSMVFRSSENLDRFPLTYAVQQMLLIALWKLTAWRKGNEISRNYDKNSWNKPKQGNEEEWTFHLQFLYIATITQHSLTQHTASSLPTSPNLEEGEQKKRESEIYLS